MITISSPVQSIEIVEERSAFVTVGIVKFVSETLQHQFDFYRLSSNLNQKQQVLTTELKIINCHGLNSKQSFVLPCIISPNKNVKIKEEDYFIPHCNNQILNNHILQCLKIDLCNTSFQTLFNYEIKSIPSIFENADKVIALPKHFSEKHFEDIMNGKLVDGMKVKIEVEQRSDYIEGDDKFKLKTINKSMILYV